MWTEKGGNAAHCVQPKNYSRSCTPHKKTHTAHMFSGVEYVYWQIGEAGSPVLDERILFSIYGRKLNSFSALHYNYVFRLTVCRLGPMDGYVKSKRRRRGMGKGVCYDIERKRQGGGKAGCRNDNSRGQRGQGSRRKFIGKEKGNNRKQTYNVQAKGGVLETMLLHIPYTGNSYRNQS